MSAGILRLGFIVGDWVELVYSSGWNICRRYGGGIVQGLMDGLFCRRFRRLMRNCIGFG